MLVVTGASGFIGRAVLAAADRRHIRAEGVARRPGGTWRHVEHYDDMTGEPDSVLVHLAETREASEVAADATVADRAARTAEALARAPFGHHVYVSSAAVYRPRLARPLRPGDSADSKTAYAALKRHGEQTFLAAGGTVARLANVYGGAGQSAASVIGEILAQLPEPGPIRLRNPEAVRDFIHVDDAAEALVALAVSRLSGIFHVGSGVATRIGDIATKILSLAGQSNRSVAAVAAAPEDRLALDIAGTTEAIGWRPRIGLADGLARMVDARA